MEKVGGYLDEKVAKNKDFELEQHSNTSKEERQSMWTTVNNLK
jgi:hypothetical protein